MIEKINIQNSPEKLNGTAPKLVTEYTKNSLPYSKRIKESSISRLKEILNIKDTVSEFLPLKANKACCPFHDEKTASFSINPAKNIFKCFGCGKGGNPIDFVMGYSNLSFIEAVEYLAAQNNFQLEYEENYVLENNQARKDKIEEIRQVVQFAQKIYVSELNDLNKGNAYREYLNKRGISNEAISEWELGAATESRLVTPKLLNLGKLNDAIEAGISCTKDGKNFDFHYNRITIPIHDANGRLVAIAGRQLENKIPKYLNPIESELYKKSNNLFGLHQAITAKAFSKKIVYIVEGYFDVISLHESGCLNTVAACGTSISDNQIKLLKRYVDHVVIFFDSDAAGIEKSKKLIDQLLRHDLKVEIIELPDKMDPDEYARKFNKTKPDEDFQEHLFSLRQDAVLWKAGKLFNKEIDPDALAKGVDIMVETLLNISNETKRKAYVDQIPKKYKNSSTLKGEVKKAFDKRERQAAQKKENAIIDKLTINNEDAGLPYDYDGDIRPVLKYGVYEYKGMYYVKGKPGAISNFTMQILYHINSNREVAYKIVKVINEYGFETVIQINTDDWISPGGFKKALARKGDYVFKGNESDLSRLQQYLQESELDSQLIEILGYNKRGNFYAFANGIISLEGKVEPTILKTDKYGIVNSNGINYCLPALSKMYDDKDELFITEKKFLYVEPENKISFNEWAIMFNNAYGEKGMVAIIWLLATFFRDVIMSNQGSFPILSMFGQRGSGKGQLINSVLRFFGEPQEQIMLGGESTPKGFMRKFAQLSNAIVWGDEYKNNLDKKIIENLKNIFDGTGYITAQRTQDFQTNTSPIRSSLILSGQEMPIVEPALFSRVIMLQFMPGKFSDKQKKNFSLLKNVENNGLSYLTTDILRHRQLFINDYKAKYHEIDDKLTKEINNKEIDERFIKNISTLATVYSLLSGSIDFPFTYVEFTNYLKDNMMEQFKILTGNDDLGKWWQTIEFLAQKGEIKEGKDYLFEGNYFMIRINNVHPLYLKELRSQGSNGIDKPTIINYIEKDSCYIDHVRKTFPNDDYRFVRCYKVKYDKLGIELFKKPVEYSEQKKSLSTAFETNRITAEEFIERYKEIDIEEKEASETKIVANDKNDTGDDLPF